MINNIEKFYLLKLPFLQAKILNKMIKLIEEKGGYLIEDTRFNEQQNYYEVTLARFDEEKEDKIFKTGDTFIGIVTNYINFYLDEYKYYFEFSNNFFNQAQADKIKAVSKDGIITIPGNNNYLSFDVAFESDQITAVNEQILKISSLEDVDKFAEKLLNTLVNAKESMYLPFFKLNDITGELYDPALKIIGKYQRVKLPSIFLMEENMKNKSISFFINKENQLKFQKEVNKTHWNKDKKIFEVVKDEQGNILKATRSIIAFPSGASVDIDGSKLELKGYRLDTTAPVITPHKFDLNGNDLGVNNNSKSMLVFLNPNNKYLISKVDYLKDENNEIIKDENGIAKLDYANATKYYVEALKIKEAMDFSKRQKEKQTIEHQKNYENITDLNNLFKDNQELNTEAYENDLDEMEQ